jgi:hypothetical protein
VIAEVRAGKRQSYFPCGLVASQSWMSVVIVVENAFRPYDGRSAAGFAVSVLCGGGEASRREGVINMSQMTRHLERKYV